MFSYSKKLSAKTMLFNNSNLRVVKFIKYFNVKEIWKKERYLEDC